MLELVKWRMFHVKIGREFVPHPIDFIFFLEQPGVATRTGQQRRESDLRGALTNEGGSGAPEADKDKSQYRPGLPEGHH